MGLTANGSFLELYRLGARIAKTDTNWFLVAKGFDKRDMPLIRRVRQPRALPLESQYCHFLIGSGSMSVSGVTQQVAHI